MCGSWHEVRNIHSLRFPCSSWLTWQRFDTVPPHSSVGHSCPVSVQNKKKRNGLNRTSVVSAKGRAAASHHISAPPLCRCLSSSAPDLFSSVYFSKHGCRRASGERKRGSAKRGEEWKDGNGIKMAGAKFLLDLYAFLILWMSQTGPWAQMGWFSSMWSTQLFLFHYFQLRVSPSLTLLRFSYSYMKASRQIFPRQVFKSRVLMLVHCRDTKSVTINNVNIFKQLEQHYQREAPSENAFVFPLLWNPHVSVWTFNSWHSRLLNNNSNLISVSSTSSFIVGFRSSLDSTAP